MKTYAIRCIKATEDDKITWEVGHWHGRFSSISEFEHATIFASREAADLMMEIMAGFNEWGFEFELVEFAHMVDYSGCLDDALIEAGLDDDLAFSIRTRFEEFVKELGGEI